MKLTFYAHFKPTGSVLSNATTKWVLWYASKIKENAKMKQHPMVCTFLSDFGVLEVFDPDNSMRYFFNMTEPVMSKAPVNADSKILNNGEAWSYLNEMLNYRKLVGDVDVIMDVIEKYDAWLVDILDEEDLEMLNKGKMVL